jgi:hypothetical protein
MSESHFKSGGWGYGGGLDMRFSKGESAMFYSIKSITYIDIQSSF